VWGSELRKICQGRRKLAKSGMLLGVFWEVSKCKSFGGMCVVEPQYVLF
jgi:hypothetical protein